MIYLIALLPALGFGLVPIISGKVGGSAANQIFGIGAGASIIGILSFILFRPHVSLLPFCFALVCGALWTIGQIGAFISYQRIGVANTVPLSTTFQLIGNSIIGVLAFHEWRTPRQLTIGFVALALVVFGALCTSVTNRSGGHHIHVTDILFLLITTIGYWVYSAFPKIPLVSRVDSVGVFLPEMLGILVGAVIYEAATHNLSAFREKAQYGNIFNGISWGLAALAYIFAARQIGVTQAFVFTQLNVIIGTLGGVFILHEEKTRLEMRFIIIGIIFIIAGSIMTSFA
ncbi:GRP family sugar transporter [Limosilactobacillus sp.]|uniref:GRP family sugar transporter n=1 Tax=Limosilactobacillus sp. TaxID=2773925 RepID=UPI00345E5213